ncbi:enolase C-terminal domain-like protein [Actinomadura sp. 6K520]|uniref:enolase C-terminal domain-like protein n=1 Tax=Actinomadura sp. 6K520 TaxID=2530364 RepID=UPI00104C3F61|nr:enolase C-terminal domain-like protein [Actinomadura sp. 6K520]TDE27386.1 mandelate racemase [Actinomadura sp. 6K520]
MAGADGAAGGDAVPVTGVRVHAFTVPTDGPDGVEEDGTLRWDSTTMVLVEADAGGRTGIGYTYGDVSLAPFIESKLAPVVRGSDALAPAAAWHAMFAAIRNVGRPGPGAMAVSAVDAALWDVKARLLGLPLYRVLPAFHDEVPVYGSGGFTNYPLDRLARQLGDWVERGVPRVKLKISREPGRDPERLAAVREAIGPEGELFADANGALTRKDALYWAHRLAGEWDVRWFEEPVSSDDTAGLRLLRDRGPGRLEIAAGEYGYVLGDFTGLLDGAVDCLQADVTRCGGVTGVLQVAGLAAAYRVDLSAHCAPALSAHAFCAVERLRHLEYFHDHVRVEDIVFDGTLSPAGGSLRPAPDRPGLGLEVRWADAERYRVHGARRR